MPYLVAHQITCIPQQLKHMRDQTVEIPKCEAHQPGLVARTACNGTMIFGLHAESCSLADLANNESPFRTADPI